MDELYRKMFSRNAGLISPGEQEQLRGSTIAIAGMGGVGGLLAERLIRLGVGHIKITDPETFEYSNFNRQYGSGVSSAGRNKAAVVQETICSINPGAKVEWEGKGITDEAGTARFIEGCDLVIDEMDMTAFKQSLILQRAARKKGLYYLFTSAIGFGALAAIFAPGGMTLEEYNRLPVDVDLSTLGSLSVPFDKAVPVLPSYTPADIGALAQGIASGKMALPTTSIGAGLASMLAANEALNILLKKRTIITAPQYIYLDLMDQKFIIGQG